LAGPGWAGRGSARLGKEPNGLERRKEKGMKKEAKMWNAGIPYSPDVKMLEDTYPQLEEGSMIVHSDFEEILKMKAGSQRYYGVINSWRKYLRRTRDIDTEWDRGVGLKILTPGERMGCGENDLARSIRASGRAIKRTLGTDRDRLDETGKRRYDHIASKVKPFLEFANRTRREISIDIAPVKSLPKPKIMAVK
jgi:hypothetical protein